MLSYFTHGVTLAYRTFGNGPSPVLALHGFGRTGADFEVLAPALGKYHTIHAFDLHFHGMSPGYPERAEVPFTPHELAVFFAAFLDHIGSEKASLLGYSLGGRIAMSLLETMPERIEQVFLAAPDGLKPRPWYRGLAATSFGRWAYRRFVEHPHKVHALMDLLGSIGLLRPKMLRFLRGQTDSQAKRILLRDVWLSYRLIEPDLERVAQAAQGHTIPIHLFFGEMDTVIKPVLGEDLRRHAPEEVSITLLPFGHVLLTPELGRAMLRTLPNGAVETV
ncbi:MAG: alpha/beta hydrolase [Flavobacteriales bacterium]|nr:alpha/beta hydrolase [Flavobacteriales bacterium]